MDDGEPHGRKIRYGHYGHYGQSLLAIDPATVGQNQPNLGVVGHLGIPIRPLLLRA